MGVTIRAARGRELIDGTALLASALEFGERDAIPPWLLQAAGECGGVALGAFDGAALVGFSCCLPALGYLDASLYSCGLAVAPAFRGRGLGRRLKLAQRAWALRRGHEAIAWTADPLAAPALALYLSGLGARLVRYRAGLFGEVRVRAGDDVDILWRLHGAPARAGRGELVEITDGRSPGDVRAAMSRLLARGLVGTEVVCEDGRCWVRFA